jgi:hypothetical protein
MSTIGIRSPASYWLAVPAAVWMLGVVVVPIVLLVWVSFWGGRTFSPASPLTFDNYARFFANQTYLKLALSTILHTVTLMAVTGLRSDRPILDNVETAMLLHQPLNPIDDHVTGYADQPDRHDRGIGAGDVETKITIRYHSAQAAGIGSVFVIGSLGSTILFLFVVWVVKLAHQR